MAAQIIVTLCCGGVSLADAERLQADHGLKRALGKGLMLGIEFVKDHATKTPDREECAQAVENARELGLLLVVLDEALGAI